MPSRNQINDRIEAYAKAVKDKNAKAVSELFAESFDHIVHGAGSDPGNPWNTKRERDREGIYQIYKDFFNSVVKMSVEYTDRCIDVESNSASVVVRVKSEDANMENALQIKWNDEGKIVFFYNWYGEAVSIDN
jgi:hypothetical protein